MASWRELGVAGVVAILTAVLFGLGTGLHPVAALTWLAPLPALLLATRAGVRATALAAFLGYAASTSGLVRFQVDRLQVPVPVVAGLVVATSLVFTLVVLLFHALVRRERLVLAWLAPAAGWAAVEFLASLVTSYGSNWSLANAQLGHPDVTDLAAWTGFYGCSFLIMATATGVALTLGRDVPARRRAVACGLTGALVVAVLAVGASGARVSGSERVQVTAVAAHRGGTQPFANTAEGRRLIDADVAWVRRPRVPRARLVVFPESDLQVDDRSYPAVARRFSRAAGDSRATIVLGVARLTPGRHRNQALVFGPDGGPPAVYDKQYPIVGQESDVTPGHALGLTGRRGRIGVAICADLAHPVLGRRYAQAGARVLAVPALDFDVDDEMTSRVQLMRGVESGFATVRAARDGFVTIADEHGRVLAERRTGGSAPYVAVSADVPYGAEPTFYARHGDWFGWTCVSLVLLGLLALLTPARRRQPVVPVRSRQPETVR